MPVTIYPAMPADAESMITVLDAAFGPSAHYQMMYPSGEVPLEDKCARVSHMREALGTNPYLRVFKAVDAGGKGGEELREVGQRERTEEEKERNASSGSFNGNADRLKKGIEDSTEGNGEIVGWAQWKVYKTHREKEEWAKPFEGIEETDDSRDKMGNMNVEYTNWFFGTMDENRKRLFGGMPYCTLSILVVDPHYQTRGIGFKLLQWGIAESIREQLPLYLESSREGFKLYRQNGFKKLENIGIDPNSRGMVDIPDIIPMIRLPTVSGEVDRHKGMSGNLDGKESGNGYSYGNGDENGEGNRKPSDDSNAFSLASHLMPPLKEG